MTTKRSDSEDKPRRLKPMVGWREWASLPDLGIQTVKAKVDTGARTSALHALGIEVREGPSGDVVRFRVRLHHDAEALSEILEFPVLAMRGIKSSNGEEEIRPVILTDIVIGEARWEAEVTLTTRHEMGFDMLLGRAALRGMFWIDPARSFLMRKSAPPYVAVLPDSPQESP